MTGDRQANVFEWEGVHYTIPEIKDPVLLPSGEVFHVSISPNDPNQIGELTKEYTLNTDVGGEEVDMDKLAKILNGVLAIEVVVSTKNVCPNGCKRPTAPFCRKCGSRVESTKQITPVKR